MQPALEFRGERVTLAVVKVAAGSAPAVQRRAKGRGQLVRLGGQAQPFEPLTNGFVVARELDQQGFQSARVELLDQLGDLVGVRFRHGRIVARCVGGGFSGQSRLRN